MFQKFLHKLKTPENSNLIEAIHQGYKACFESEERQILESKLKEKLLSLGGNTVNLKYEEMWELKRLINDGRIFTEKVTFVKGIPSQCHRNIAFYYKNNDWHQFKIITGYALSGGKWVQHTWGTKQNHPRIIESTKDKRDIYYGYELTSNESENFCEENE